MQTVITLLVVLVLMTAGIGFVVRGVFGPVAATAYQHGIGRMVAYIGRQIVRFVRWTAIRHSWFWVGVVVGIMVMILFFSP